MRGLLMGLALGAAMVVGAATADANMCPLLVAQLNDQLGKMSADDQKVARAKKLTADCKKLHDEGKHADSVKKCEEAAKVAGITLEMKH
jgi:hypothetical protein